MDKYAVDTEVQEGDKTASENRTCPVCGSKLDPNSPTPRCPTHGTKPFETK